MHKLETSFLDLIAAHLNAPYGPIVQPLDVKAAFRAGSFDVIQNSPLAKELIASMFIELESEIIGRASFEAGVRRRKHKRYMNARLQIFTCLGSSVGKTR